MNSNLIAVNWNYQKSKTIWNLSCRKTQFWLLYQHINKKKLAKIVKQLQEFAITWILTEDAVKLSCRRESLLQSASFSASNLLINSLLTHNLITAHWFEYFTALIITNKLRCLPLIQNDKLSSYEVGVLFIIETSRVLL